VQTDAAKEFGRDLLHEVQEDDVLGLAAELAYKFFLALFPFLIFLTALGGFAADAFHVEDPTQRILDQIGGALPNDARSLVETQLNQVVESQNPTLLTIGIVGAIWAASGGVQAMMKAMNRAYGVPERRQFWKRYLLAVSITLLAGTAMIVAFLVMVTAEVWGKDIADAIGAGGAFEAVITWGRWPVVALILLVAIAFVYWAVPNIELPFRWVSPGAVAFTAVWLVASYLFALYVAHGASYNATYGTLGGVVALLLWFYITSIVLLMGAEVNAVLEKRAQPAGMAHRQAVSEAKAEDHDGRNGDEVDRRPAEVPAAGKEGDSRVREASRPEPRESGVGAVSGRGSPHSGPGSHDDHGAYPS
jgi:membrane protein